jgi:sterol desaturase/sphingolipid hydroxylase (fatty acid hydroxylase superfamily)
MQKNINSHQLTSAIENDSLLEHQVTKQRSGSIKIFNQPFLEALTHVDPLTPLILWLPTVIFLYWRALWLNEVALSTVALYSVLGVLGWTFVEYTLHRFGFHFKGKSAFAQRTVYVTHGLHHDDPEDKTRLVMPPVPALIYVFILYHFFMVIFGAILVDVFFAAFLAAYLGYDYIHYSCHHFKPKTFIGRYLKKHHLHHHAVENIKYGVSNPLWDWIFFSYHPKKNSKKSQNSKLKEEMDSQYQSV